MNSLKLFKFVSIAEGVSLLLLFGIAMPLKYILHKPFMVEIVGMAHGILFVIYVLFACIYKFKLNWKTLDFFIVLIASVIPFGTFYIEKKYLEKINA